MKEQGVPDDDPEFIKCRQFLAAVSQQTQFKKMKAQQQEVLARQRQAQQQQQQATTNGANGNKNLKSDL
jgi:ATP-dependent helicase STH1/SNF2